MHEPAAFQPTDLMHRRSLLNSSARYLWHSRIVQISTNSALAIEKAAEAGLVHSDPRSMAADFRWEIACERGGDSYELGNSTTTSLDEDTVYVAMEDGQWFAFDRECGDGAGFLSSGEDGAKLLESFIHILEQIQKFFPQSEKEPITSD